MRDDGDEGMNRLVFWMVAVCLLITVALYLIWGPREGLNETYIFILAFLWVGIWFSFGLGKRTWRRWFHPPLRKADDICGAWLHRRRGRPWWHWRFWRPDN